MADMNSPVTSRSSTTDTMTILTTAPTTPASSETNMKILTTAPTTPVSEDNISTKMSILTSLFPPKLSIGRPRSLSVVSFTSSRSGTPVPSLAPSTPHFSDLSPRSSAEVGNADIIDFAPRIVHYLDARGILSLSATTRRCRDLRTSLTFQNHLAAHGWDTGALIRRAEEAKDVRGRVWMFLARSAVNKGDILKQYELLPKEGDKKKSSSKDKKAVEKFLRILIDVATEHDHYNFETLASLAGTLQMGLIQFMGTVRAHDWKTRYRKTFVIAAFTNSQPIYPEAQDDLERMAETLDFENPKPPVSLIATRANFLYTYSRLANPTVSPTCLSSIDYDPPHFSTPRGTPLPGVRQAIERYKLRTTVKGFYRKAGGDRTPLNMAIEPKGLASKSSLPFKEKDLITLTMTCTDGGENPSWEMNGYVNSKTGVGNLKGSSGIIEYELWTTPWGLTGQKVRGDKHLGYFVQHWT